MNTKKEDILERLTAHVLGPIQCPICCNRRNAEFIISDSDDIPGCRQEGQCDWRRNYGTHTDAFDDPFRAKTDILEAVTELSRLRAENERLRDALEEEQRLRKSVIALLYTDEVFVGSHWEDFPNAEAGVWPQLCAHIRNYGADAEEIPYNEINLLAELVAQFGSDAIEAWVCFKRGGDNPPRGALGDDGKKALAFLRENRARKALERRE